MADEVKDPEKKPAAGTPAPEITKMDDDSGESRVDTNLLDKCSDINKPEESSEGLDLDQSSRDGMEVDPVPQEVANTKNVKNRNLLTKRNTVELLGSNTGSKEDRKSLPGPVHTSSRTQTRSHTAKSSSMGSSIKRSSSSPGDFRIHKVPNSSGSVSATQPILARSSHGYVLIPPNEYVNKRRVSSRNIKRKKFDDEVVESSLLKTNIPPPKGKGGLVVPGGTVSATPPYVPVVKEEKEKKTEQKVEVKPPKIIPKAPAEVKPAVAKPPKPTPSPTIVTPQAEKKPKLSRQSSSSSTSTSKRSKKARTTVPVAKDLTRWRPEDDLALISAVQQTNDLEAVYQGVKFLRHFTMKEIEERWYALLYDPVASKLAQQAMRTLHPDLKTAVLAKALFSEDEEKLLGTVPVGSQPKLDAFQQLINKNATVFHPSRTAKSLQSHWLLMKQYHLLPDQSVQPMPKGDHVLNFSDAEDMLDDSQLQDPRDEILEHELAQFDRRQKRQIQQLENEIPKWQVMVESVTGVSTQEFDNQTLAVLRGRLVRYLMRSKEITLGRTSKDNNIDVDLSLEGPAFKVSRRQGIIKLKNNGDFYIVNEGKRAIYVDGKAIMTGQKLKLSNSGVLEIAGLRFIFLINQELINTMRTDTSKVGGQ